VSRPVSSPANVSSGRGPVGSAGVPGSSPTQTPPPTAAGVPAGSGTPPTSGRGGAGGWWTRVWPWARWVLLAVAAAVALVAIWLGWLFATVDLPADPPQLSSSVLLDANGTELAVLSQGERRTPVSLDQVAPVVPQALVASEDRTFWEHGGVNPLGIARALVVNVRSDGKQGGSTITQQLVKNEFLTSERTWTRKIREAVMAVKLERRSDKRAILERYLNTVYFGRGSYGIEAASRAYFDRPAKDLTTSQAAYLIGLLPGPSGVDPVTNPDKAVIRRDAVLRSMVDAGVLSGAEADVARAEPLTAVPPRPSTQLTAGVAAHFVSWVRGELVNRYGESAVAGGGLRVTTTLDLDDQRAAEEAVAKALPDPADPQAALVGVDKSGAIRAFVGSRDGAQTQVDMARGTAGGGGGRQAGSTFKPFALAAALDHGIALDHRYPAPAELTLPTPGGPWTVHNYGDEGFGPLTLQDATAESVNTVYARLGTDVGTPSVADAARRAGITSTLPEEPSLVLGVADVSPLEMAGAYLTFARDGRPVTPFAVTDVRQGVETLAWDGPPPAAAGLAEGVARAVNTALQDVVARGTGRAAKLDRPMAGKTGTTEGNGDAWFAGYTPEYTAVVWMGYPQGAATKMTDVHGRAISGGTMPAEIWKAFAARALADVPPTPFAPPPDELLHGRMAPTTLTVAAGALRPGAVLTATGTGYYACVASFMVEATPAAGGAAVRSAPEVGSTSGGRTAQLTLPADAAPGAWRAVALCDDGTGPAPRGEAPFTVEGPPPTTAAPAPTTTAAAARSTTTATTAPARSSTTTVPKPTTTTTKGPNGG
jgi:penicillin-binding protein 1A